MVSLHKGVNIATSKTALKEPLTDVTAAVAGDASIPGDFYGYTVDPPEQSLSNIHRLKDFLFSVAAKSCINNYLFFHSKQ